MEQAGIYQNAFLHPAVHRDPAIKGNPAVNWYLTVVKKNSTFFMRALFSKALCALCSEMM